MADVSAITFTFTGNAAGVVAAANQVTGALGAVEAAAKRTEGVLGSAFRGVTAGVGMAAGLAGINGIAGALKLAGDATVGFNARLEQSTIAFTSMLGSAEKAKSFLDDLKQFAATTPFEFEELLGASKRMLAFGFSAKEVRPLLTAVGSAAAAMGGGSVGVDAITRALGQMRAATVVQAGELNQLTEQGVPAFELLANKMGITTGEVKKLASEGKIASSIFIDAFQEWAQANFGDMMAKQALTFDGAIATIKDSLTFASAQAFKPFFEVLSQGAVTLSQLVQTEQFTAWADGVAASFADVFRQLGDAVRTVQQVFANDWLPSAEIAPFVNLVGRAATVVRDLVTTVQELPEPVKAAAAGFVVTVAAVGPLVAAFGAASGVIAAVGAGLAVLTGPIGLVAAAVGLLAAAWVGNWFGIQEATASAWAAIQPTFAALVDWLAVQIPPVLTWITTVGWPMLVAAGQAAADWIMSTAVPAFQSIVTWLGENIPPVLTWISDVGWPALVSAGQAVSEWITGTAIPAFTDLVEWLGPKISAVTTWISDTGWPALVTAGEKVGTMVQTVIQFFKDLYVELDKRGTFDELGRIWDTLVGIGDKLWSGIKKLNDITAPFFGAIQTFNTGAGATFVGVLGGIAEKAGAAVRPVELVAGAVDGFLRIIGTQLRVLESFIGLLDRLSGMRMPSLSVPTVGPDGGGPVMQTMGFTGDNEAKIARAGVVAMRAGHDAEGVAALQAVLRTEGGLQGAVGDNGQSFGPYQLYAGGQLPRFAAWLKERGIAGDPRQLANDIDLSTQFAAEGYLGQAIKAGQAMGLRGPALATHIQRTGQVSINPEKAGQNWRPPVLPAMTPGGNVLSDMQRMPLTGGLPGSEPGHWPLLMDQTNEQLPAWLQTMETIQTSGQETFATVAQAGSEAGQSLVTMSTDHMGNVMRIYQDATGVLGATITDAAGVIVNAWGSMGTTVVEQVAQTGTRLIEETTNAAGVTVEKYQEMSGQIVTIVTDQNGKVVADFTTAAEQVGATTDGLGTRLVSSTANSMGGVTEIYREKNGEVVTIVTDASGKVVSEYSTMQTQGGSAITQLANTSKDQFGVASAAATAYASTADTVTQAHESIRPINMRDTVKQFGDAARAAEEYKKKVLEAARASEKLPGNFSGSRGGGSGEDNPFSRSKRHSGGPVEAGVPYLVGRDGAEELFVPRTSGHVLAGTVVGAGSHGIDEERLARLIAAELVAALPPAQVNHFNGLTSDEAWERAERERRTRAWINGVRG